MKDMAGILQVSSSLTLIKLIDTHKVANHSGKMMIYEGLMVMQFCFGMQILRNITLVVVYADW